MHEASLVDALFDQVDASLGAHPSGRLRLVRVRLGELAGVDPELFRSAFDVLRSERGYSRAALELVDEAAVWRCPSCAAQARPGGVLQCPSCGRDLSLAAGGDIVLERIELEVADV